ncbi:hypothetical protein WAB97_005735 [Stenotrophomonas maltophilia]|uniref:hypothetical protein n=1 Tax=Stenotrophomonas maltophilia TaxID=40324 RepID=UPI00331DF58E
MTLAIIAASSASLPASAPAVAGARSFPHLSCVAGVASASPSPALLRASGYEPSVHGGHRNANVGALVETHARALLQSLPGQQPPVKDVLHCQATLLDQILESVCLRVAHGCAPEPRRAMTIDQTGTTGVATALFLGLHAGVASAEGLLLVTAADAWSATFPGSFAPLATYRNGVGALLLRQVDPAWQGEGELAHVLAVACRPASTRGPFWSSGPQGVRAGIFERLLVVTEEVLAAVGWTSAELDLLLGDPIGLEVGADLATHLGIPPLNAPQECGDHAASVALIGNIERAVEFARTQGRPVKCLLWTASAEGSAAAVVLHAFPLSSPTTA